MSSNQIRRSVLGNPRVWNVALLGSRCVCLNATTIKCYVYHQKCIPEEETFKHEYRSEVETQCSVSAACRMISTEVIAIALSSIRGPRGAPETVCVALC